MIMPSFLLSLFFVHAISHTTILKPTRITISTTFSIKNAIGLMDDATPSTSSILKILDPTTFPTAISGSFFFAATMDVTSSGRLVPTATTVRVSPKLLATIVAPSTTKSPPNLIAAAPPMIYTIHFHAGNVSISSSPASRLAFNAEKIIHKR